jgi:hypothetical protein
MEEYTATLESLGDSLIVWADPEGRFSGFTKVSERKEKIK